MVNDGQSLTLGEAASRFLASIPSEQAQMSQQEIYKFVRWFGWNRPFAGLAAPEVANYAERLSLSDTDYVRKLELIRVFLAHAKKEGWSKVNLVTHLKTRKGKSAMQPSISAARRETVALTQEGYAELAQQVCQPCGYGRAGDSQGQQAEGLCIPVSYRPTLRRNQIKSTADPYLHIAKQPVADQGGRESDQPEEGITQRMRHDPPHRPRAGVLHLVFEPELKLGQWYTHLISSMDQLQSPALYGKTTLAVTATPGATCRNPAHRVYSIFQTHSVRNITLVSVLRVNRALPFFLSYGTMSTYASLSSSNYNRP